MNDQRRPTITPSQRRVLHVLRDRERHKLRDVMDALGYTSTNTAWNHLHRLAKRGLVDHPGGYAVCAGYRLAASVAVSERGEVYRIRWVRDDR